MAEFVGSWIRLADADVVVVGVAARLVSALSWIGATPASAAVVESAKAKRIWKTVKTYIAHQF